MAENLAARLSLDDVRASMKRVQSEGRKLVTRFRKDATALVNRRPLELVDDARKRATKAVHDLDAQRRRVRGFVAEGLTAIADRAVTGVGLARAQDVAELKRRLSDLERRIERVTKAA